MSKDVSGGMASLGLLGLRVSAGLTMLLLHGWDKLTNFSDMKDGFPDPAGVGSDVSLIIAVAAEFFAAALVVLGLGTRFAALAVAVVMGVAAFKHHASDPWETKELAVVYFGAFLTLVGTGGGQYSLDAVARRRK